MFRKINIHVTKIYKKHNYHTTKLNLNKYSSTVLLPKTKFPQKLIGNKLTEQQKHVHEKTGFNELYAWQRENLTNDEFVLHDGPPYANGAPHMGHAINKILKDVINRRQILLGKRVNYIPGWDCHGLPIELKAMTKIKTDNKEKKTDLFIRATARNFATKTIEKQRETFKSWGIIADWDKSYFTYSESYIKNQMEQFYKLYEKKLIYQDVKPVYWSPSSRTALAEAELIYNENHKSTAVYVRFKIDTLPEKLRQYLSGDKLYALIWTTTPWTLPSNQAICFNPKLSYSFVKCDKNTYLIATDLIETVAKSLNTDLQKLTSFKGHNLNGTTYKYPFNNNEILPFLSGDHPTATKGTGLVHTAPAHGPDDFLVALHHKIPIKCFVNEAGCYTNDSFKGLSVLAEGNDAVLTYLKDDILSVCDFVHSYPYDWRTNKPVIIRASKQWFIDTDSIKNRAIELLDHVRIYPEKNSDIYKNNLINQLKKRPFWCISRQRVWGVPIPVFYNKNTNEPIVITKSLINHLCELLEKHGSDYWWKLPIDVLVPSFIQQQFNLKLNEIEKGNDILDIWFDSGISWSSVLGDEKIADFYVEGVDQFTGWFQSSLITSVALRDQVPYKNIYVHGFAVDGNGHKMSKSVGNVVDPQHVIHGDKKKQRPFGIDALRWWVVGHASQNSTAFVTDNVLQASWDEVQKIRNTLRFALANLNGSNNDETNIKMNLIDVYLLHLLYEFDLQIRELYQNYQFNKLCIVITQFVTNPISALYFSIIKDRLYCDLIEDPSRKAAQFVLERVLNIVSKACAPITPHLIEELFYYHPNNNKTFFQTTNNNDEWLKREYFQPDVARIMGHVLNIKKDLNKLTSNSLEVDVDLNVSSELYQDLKMFQSKQELIEILQIADVSITESVELLNECYTITTTKTKNYVCLRCKLFNSIDVNVLCNRCSNTIDNQM